MPSSKPQAIARPNKRSRRVFRWSKIEYICLVTVWGGLSLTLSQWLVSQLLFLVLGERLLLPGWMLVYYILAYALMFTLILLVPPRLYAWLQQHQFVHKLRTRTRRHNKHKNTTKVSAAKAISDSENLPKSSESYTVATNTEEIGVAKPLTFVDIGLAPIGYVVYAVLAQTAVQILSGFKWFNADEAQDVGFPGYLAGLDRFYAIIAIVFLAPIAEEILMRGWLYGKLRNQLRVWPAVLIVSLLFAFLHGQLNVGISVFILSLILCSLREITGSIWAGILLHMLTNGIAFYYLYVAGF